MAAKNVNRQSGSQLSQSSDTTLPYSSQGSDNEESSIKEDISSLSREDTLPIKKSDSRIITGNDALFEEEISKTYKSRPSPYNTTNDKKKSLLENDQLGCLILQFQMMLQYIMF